MEFKKLYLAMSFALLSSYSSANGLTNLTDKELSEQTGQALFNLSYIAPTDSSNLMNGKTIGGNSAGAIGFYKLGMEADIDLNTNIRSLQLGCGGVNGPGACDIEINNLALSALPDGYDSSTGTSPNFGSTQRASTSAKLVNPFIEFAIKNPNTASTREFVGVRLSAEKIFGLLTLGTDNSANPTADGLQTLSGFMRLASTSGSVNTKETLFGNTADQILGAVDGRTDPNMIVNLLGQQKRIFTSNPGAAGNDGISIPSMKNIGFTMPAAQVNGVRSTSANVSGIKVKINEIPMGKVTGADGNFTSDGAKNQLYVTYDPILLVAKDAKFIMADGSNVTNLNLDVTFQQALSMIHNIPLTGNGGYLSLQNQKLLWPGAYTTENAGVNELNSMTKSDVAQPGWWMSFADPVQLGKLNGTSDVDISAALPQVAYLVSKYLQDNPVQVDAGEGIGALFGTPITKLLNIDLNAYTTANPVKVTLQNLQLANQGVTPNCYGSLKFC
ncbi:hypothetical protein [Acinetobacter ursingii]|uniref:hypothetical protein n=2 Tax=Acinetobacter ursingii TaxID=108980 RepID=UPI0030083E16